MSLENINDFTNLTGLSALINKSYIDEKLDLDKIERSMVGDEGVKIIEETDPAKEFENTIKELSANTGINLDANIYENNYEKTEAPIKENFDIEDSDYFSSFEDDEPPKKSSAPVYSSNYTPSKKEEVNFDQYNPFINENVQNTQHTRYSAPNVHSYSSTPRMNPSYDNGLDDILKAYSGQQNHQINMDRERDEEMLNMLLENIEELKAELQKDNIDISRIPEVNEDSNIRTVKMVYKLLQNKYDRNRCNTFGSELILAGAQGLGYFFDGKRQIGPFRPNLAGWHNTVRPKLRRMRYETSTIISNIMQEFNIGPIGRIAIELIPSAIIYNNTRREQNGRKNYTQDQMSEALDELRQFDSE